MEFKKPPSSQNLNCLQKDRTFREPEFSGSLVGRDRVERKQQISLKALRPSFKDRSIPIQVVQVESPSATCALQTAASSHHLPHKATIKFNTTMGLSRLDMLSPSPGARLAPQIPYSDTLTIPDGSEPSFPFFSDPEPLLERSFLIQPPSEHLKLGPLLKPTFQCSEAVCAFNFEGFETKAKLEKHMKEQHRAPIFPPTQSDNPSRSLSPHSHKEWMEMAAQKNQPRPGPKRVRASSPQTPFPPFPRRDSIRKEDAYLKIIEWHRLNIDQRIANTANEEEVKEHKQQRRLLRNRLAAYEYRQKKHIKERHGADVKQPQADQPSQNSNTTDQSAAAVALINARYLSHLHKDRTPHREQKIKHRERRPDGSRMYMSYTISQDYTMDAEIHQKEKLCAINDRDITEKAVFSPQDWELHFKHSESEL